MPKFSLYKIATTLLKGYPLEKIADIHSWLECQKHCTDNSLCKSFFLSPSGSCYLNSDVPYDNSRKRKGYSSGIKGCPYTDCQLDNIYLKGSLVKDGEFKDIRSWYECQQLCAFNPECESFTWNYTPYVCYLLSNVPDKKHTGKSKSAISGIKRCWDPSYCKYQ